MPDPAREGLSQSTRLALALAFAASVFVFLAAGSVWLQRSEQDQDAWIRVLCMRIERLERVRGFVGDSCPVLPVLGKEFP